MIQDIIHFILKQIFEYFQQFKYVLCVRDLNYYQRKKKEKSITSVPQGHCT